MFFVQFIKKFIIINALIFPYSDGTNAQEGIPSALTTDNQTQTSSQALRKSYVLKPKDEEALKAVFSDISISSDCYYLQGIIVLNSQKWIAFINDQVYSPQLHLPNIMVIDVQDHKMLVKSKYKTDLKPVWLDFNQTYCPDTHEVFSGDQTESFHNEKSEKPINWLLV